MYKYIFLLLCLWAKDIKSQNFKIQGTTNDNSHFEVVRIYRWIDSFKKEFITEDSVRNNKFSFEIYGGEPNAYFITSPSSPGGLLFIVDEDLYIELDSNISNSKIVNSKLNRELQSFFMQLDSLYGPVRTRAKTIDNILQFNKFTGADLSKLQTERDSLRLVLRKGLIKSIFDYAKNNRDSFVSLYLLTRTGTEVAHEGFYEALHSLSPYLKSHSRAKPYLKKIDYMGR